MNFRGIKKRLPSPKVFKQPINKGTKSMERQLRNRLHDGNRLDPRPRVGRQRQEALELRRATKPRPIYCITAPLGFVRRQVGAGSVYANLWQSDKYYRVGSCTCQGVEITIKWNADSKGELARTLHESGSLVFTPSAESGSLVAMFNGATR